MHHVQYLVMGIIGIIGLLATYHSIQEKNFNKAILAFVATITINLFSNYLFSFVLFPNQSDSNDISNQVTNEQKVNIQTNNEPNISKQDTNQTTIDDQTNISLNKTEQEPNKQSNSDTNSNKLQNTVNYISDISKNNSVSGSIIYQDQKDNYKYTAPVTGTYRFDTNLSAGGEVRIRISGEQGNSLNYNTNALTMDLEADKTYILSVEYWSVSCDYTVNINAPIEVTDITDTNIISDSITYQDQKNNYKYTAPITGIYHFENKNVGGEVRIKISSKQGNVINYATNELSVELEEGQTYIVSIEYLSTICDYSIKIYIPNDLLDITGKNLVTGSLMYLDQENKYLYTATTSGTYCFDTTLSTNGSVELIINGSNDNYIHSDLNRLIVDLTAGKTYFLIIKYFSTPCEYTINITYQ